MAKSDIRLGRGLGALLSENVDVGVADGTEFEIPLQDLKPNPYQPRGPASAEGLAELAESIREHGLLQPLVVRSRDAHWEIVAGERRWRALMLLERRAAPAIVREFTDEEMLLVALVENLQREALSALEEARSYERLADEFGLTQRDIARRVGKDRSTVANALRLLTLPASVQELVHTGEISAGHARAILGAREEAAQLLLAKRVVSRGLSVRETERRVRRLKRGRRREARRAMGPMVGPIPTFAALSKPWSEPWGPRWRSGSKGGRPGRSGWSSTTPRTSTDCLA